MNNVFYVVDNFCTYKTFEAWDKIVQGAQHWRLHLFEQTFDQVNWEIRPVDSFDDLVAQRIKKLTSKYKKIRLWYSAGRDSHFVLKQLIKNNAKIDEIVFVDWAHHSPVKKEKQEIINILRNEFNDKSIPKINIFTPDKIQYNLYWKFVSNQNQSGGVGSNYGFNVNSFSTLLDLFFETPEDTCNLFGLEKPKLSIKDNKILFQMVDSSVHHAMSPLHNIEWFFLQEDCPDLIKKQIFMLLDNIKIFAKQQNIKFKDALHLIQTKKQYYDLYCIFLGLGESVSLLTKFGGPKSFGLIENNYRDLHTVSEVDSWSAIHSYRNFRANAYDLIHQYKTENQQTKLPGILSKEYSICKLEENLL